MATSSPSPTPSSSTSTNQADTATTNASKVPEIPGTDVPPTGGIILSGAERSTADDSEEEAVSVDLHDNGPNSAVFEYVLESCRYGELSDLSSFFDSARSTLSASEPDFADMYTRDTLAQAESGSGNTGLHYAAGNGHAGVVRYLCDRLGERVGEVGDLQNEGGNTALHWACLNGHLDVVKVLADPATQLAPGMGNACRGSRWKGTDMTIKNKANRRAIDEAEYNKREEIVLYLLALEMAREKLTDNSTKGTDLGAAVGKGKGKADDVSADSDKEEEEEDDTEDIKISAGEI
ncbi:hypothetical protein PYCC9005_001587 [Savitreella phatthalungensis]